MSKSNLFFHDEKLQQEFTIVAALPTKSTITESLNKKEQKSTNLCHSKSQLSTHKPFQQSKTTGSQHAQRKPGTAHLEFLENWTKNQRKEESWQESRDAKMTFLLSHVDLEKNKRKEKEASFSRFFFFTKEFHSTESSTYPLHYSYSSKICPNF